MLFKSEQPVLGSTKIVQSVADQSALKLVASDAGSTGNLLDCQNSANTSIFSVTPAGVVTATGAIVGATRNTIAAAATLSPTSAQSGSLILMGAATGEVITLPVPVVGVYFDVVITVSNTSNFNEIKTDSASTFLLGAVEHSASGIAPLAFWADGSTIQAIKMDGAHLGGLKGSQFRLQAVSTTVWAISGINLGTSVMTTAFTATP